MSIQMIRTKPACTQRALRQLAESMGQELPTEFVAFLSKHDGARPEANEFDVGANNASGINDFFSANQILQEKTVMGDRLGAETWPIADAEGGNLVCLKRDNGSWPVIFWDHELEREVRIANSFDEFMRVIRRFDPDTVELKPGQVKSAWIDPSLLNED